MSAAVTYPHIVKEQGKPARLEKNPRWRISLLISIQRAFAWTPEEMFLQYEGSLKLSEIYAALTYYHDHKEEIDREIAEDDAAADRFDKQQQSDPCVLRLVELKKRLRIDAGNAS